MSLTESISSIKAHLTTAESELTSLQAGKKASSGRARKSLQQIKQLSHLLRKQIIEHTKGMVVKKRAIVGKRVAEEPAQTAVVEEPQTAVETPKKKEVKKRVKKEQAP
jgi:hypothetical protein